VLRPFLDQVRDVMKEKPGDGFGPDSSSNLAALRISQQMRNRIVERNDPVLDRLLRSLRAVAYKKAKLVTDGIVALLGAGEPFAVSEAYRNEFWNLYWGELVMFEGPEVETAMVGFGRKLKEIEAAVTQATPEQFAALENQLKGYLAKDFRRVARELVSRGTLPTDLRNLVTTQSHRPASKAQIDQLRSLRDELHRALDKELQEGIGRKEGVTTGL
jgi:hypothetical protein